MNRLMEKLESLAAGLGVEGELLALLLLLAVGFVAHVALGLFVRHLHQAVSQNRFNWDDVVVTALEGVSLHELVASA